MSALRSNLVNLGRRMVGPLLKNPYLARARYHRRLHRESLQYSEPPLLIYQMGKVGSKTIRRSLGAFELDRPVFHVHFLTPDRVRKTERERRKYLGTEKEHLLKHVWQYQYLRKLMARGLNGKKWKVVTLTREPIGRNISTFFENLDVELLDAGQRYRVQSDYYGFEVILNIEDVDELAQLFFEKLNHDRPLEFFDEDLKRVFDIDVFASEFPKSKGYKVFEGEHADVLLIRLENLNDCARDAFKEFLNIEGLTLINTNIGSEKAYASMYKKLKESIVLSDAYVDRMYTSKYMRHFYSEEEIAAFRAKWRTSGN
jgi:hypothetical protein